MLGPGPWIARAGAGPEPARFGHGGGVVELAGESVGLMGVAAERDCHSAFFAPPASDLRAKGLFSIDFQRPAAASKHTQGVTELLFERDWIELAGCRRPVAEWIVDMSQDGEHIAAFDQSGYFREILPDDLGRLALVVKARYPGKLLPDRQAVQRTERHLEPS